MEDIHKAARAYYNNASSELQNRAREFFHSLDTDGDSRVSYDEFMDFFKRSTNIEIDPIFFFELDTNNDDNLDFWEVLTMYYIIKTRVVWCSHCRVCLVGLYFTCVECFDSARTYDLCAKCYGERGFNHFHRHDSFLDSYILLQSRKRLRPAQASVNQLALTQQLQHVPSTSYLLKASIALQNLETALSIFSTVAGLISTGCCIM